MSITLLQERGEMQWMYINILFEMSELQVSVSRPYSIQLYGTWAAVHTFADIFPWPCLPSTCGVYRGCSHRSCT